MSGLLSRAGASCVGRSGFRLGMLVRIGELDWRDPRVFVVCAWEVLLVCAARRAITSSATGGYSSPGPPLSGCPAVLVDGGYVVDRVSVPRVGNGLELSVFTALFHSSSLRLVVTVGGLGGEVDVLPVRRAAMLDYPGFWERLRRLPGIRRGST